MFLRKVRFKDLKSGADRKSFGDFAGIKSFYGGSGKELSQLSGVQKIMNDQHLPVSYDLQALESDAEVVGFEKADMALQQSCLLNGTLSDYES